MLSYKFIDRPAPIPRQLYDETIEGIVNRNKHIEGIKAIYSFGNITAPGISDLDLLFVFKNNVTCHANGFESLPENHKPLFTHGIMAVSEKHFTENAHFTIWSDHHLLFGEAPSSYPLLRTSEEEKSIAAQTAIEFLIANYIDIKIQRSYKVIKLRAFLQHMKGLLYDLEMLNDIEDPIRIPLLQLKDWMLNWFNKTPTDNDLRQWISDFEPQYDAFVNKTLLKISLFLPEKKNYPIAGNMQLWNAKSVTYQRKGLLLPSFLSPLGRNYFKLQHKLNSFEFYCPITHESSPVVRERYSFLKRMKAYNREHLPNFMTITTSITAKLI